jgi:hypothetical protein
MVVSRAQQGALLIGRKASNACQALQHLAGI